MSLQDIKKELLKFMSEYERATNTHDFSKVRPLIAEDAVYFFSDKTLNGILEIETAFVETWEKIAEEMYSISDVDWISVTDTFAVCTYKFNWKGVVDGENREGKGRGTNVAGKRNGKWVMLHEHLSVT